LMALMARHRPRGKTILKNAHKTKNGLRRSPEFDSLKSLPEMPPV
jgi:hypothetical protein